MYTITPCSLHAINRLSTPKKRRSGASATALAHGRNSGPGNLLAVRFVGRMRRADYGAGTMAVVCFGKSSQPLICCLVRMKTRFPTGGTPNMST